MILFSIAPGLLVLVAGASDEPPQPARASADRPAAPPLLSTSDDSTGPADNELIWTWKNGLGFHSADGRFKFKFGGRIFWDLSWISGSDAFDAAGLSTEDGSEFRAARIFVSGDIDDYFFKAEYDFAGKVGDEDERPQLKDVYMGRKDVIGGIDVLAGHFKEPLGLDQLTSSRFTTFMERAVSSFSDPARNDGIMIADSALGEGLVWAVGGFRNTDDAGFSLGDGGYAVTGRVCGTPLYENDGERLIHLGAAYSLRGSKDVRLGVRPEIHNTNRWIDTGTLTTDTTSVYSAELAGVFGPFHAQAEYTQVSIEGKSGTPDPDFNGYYVQAGYFLTGEHRGYNRSHGVFDRTVPNKDWSKGGGLGAWEVAARYGTVDANDAGIMGGKIKDVTLGLNWYMNANMRIMLNYIRSDVDSPSVDDAADIFAMRFQVDW